MDLVSVWLYTIRPNVCGHLTIIKFVVQKLGAFPFKSYFDTKNSLPKVQWPSKYIIRQRSNQETGRPWTCYHQHASQWGWCSQVHEHSWFSKAKFFSLISPVDLIILHYVSWKTINRISNSLSLLHDGFVCSVNSFNSDFLNNAVILNVMVALYRFPFD